MKRKSEVDKFKLFFEEAMSKRVEPKVWFATLKHIFRELKKFIKERKK